MTFIKSDYMYYVLLLLFSVLFIILSKFSKGNDTLTIILLCTIAILTIICIIITPRFITEAIKSRDPKLIVVHIAFGLVPFLVLWLSFTSLFISL